MQVEFHPLFREDLAAASLYYLKEAGADIAEAFVNDVEQTVFRICQNPMVHSRVFDDVRRCRLSRFTAYSIRYGYDEKNQCIFIGSLLHGARDPQTALDRF